MAPTTDTTQFDAAVRGHLARAADLAVRQHPHPNPRVGCVVLDRNGAVVGEGAHAAAGQEHAEVLALADAGEAAAGGTLLVTLEPCAHHGRTPPCVDAIIAAQVRAVVIGAVDPDSRVDGAGIAALRRSGVAVTVAPAELGTEWVDPGFFHHRRTGLPFVTVKVAATLDGQIAAVDGTSQWITSPEARADGHQLRSRSDAVMVGGGTVWADDPQLGVRLVGYEGPQPTPIVVAGARGLPETAKVLDRAPLVYRTGDAPATTSDDVVVGTGPVVDPTTMLSDLGGRGILDVLVEGGPRLIRSLLDAELVQRFVWYGAGRIAGGAGLPAIGGVFGTLSDSRPLDIVEVTRVGRDVKIVADVVADRGQDA